MSAPTRPTEATCDDCGGWFTSALHHAECVAPLGVIACWGPTAHNEQCEHPHSDCYCGVFENDDRPLLRCLNCGPGIANG